MTNHSYYGIFTMSINADWSFCNTGDKPSAAMEGQDRLLLHLFFRLQSPCPPPRPSSQCRPRRTFSSFSLMTLKTQ
jgi:hypothetical protein